MKKWMLLILCLVIILAGCGEQGQATDPTDTDEFVFDTGDFSYYVNLSDEGTWDLRSSMDTQLTYMLLTREPLRADESVMLIFTDVCEYTGMECTEEWMTEFPLWLYQTYRGVDWNEVADVAKAAQAGDAEAVQKLREYENLYLEDYEALTAEDLPQIYGYWVTNNVTSVVGGTAARYEKVPMNIGNKEVTVDVGVLNVSRQGWDQYLTSEEVDEDVYMGRLKDACPTYWGDGIVTLEAMTVQKEDDPQTLRALELYGVEGEILDIQVTCGGNTQAWDGVSALEIPAGMSANLVVTLQTYANRTVGYCEDANIMLLRDVNGITQRLWYFAGISQSWNIYELYAMMVDGLDISSYYAYSAQWEQPEALPTPQSVPISFDSVTVADTDTHSVYITGASWDYHTYTLYISAVNDGTQALDLSMSNVYINDRYYGREFTAHLEPGTKEDFAWYIPWETMEEYGIHADTGEDIGSIEFNFNPLYDGMLPTDEDGYFIFNVDYTCVYPFGNDAAQDAPIEGRMVLETDTVKLYAAQWGILEYSSLSEQSYSPYYGFSLVLENLSDEMQTYQISDFAINGVPVSGTGVRTIRSGSSTLDTISLRLTEAELTEIGDPEELTFTLTRNNTDSDAVTVDLTEIAEG